MMTRDGRQIAAVEGVSEGTRVQQRRREPGEMLRRVSDARVAGRLLGAGRCILIHSK